MQAQSFFRKWMCDVELPGMERQPPQVMRRPVMAIDLAFAVGGIPHQGMADVGEVAPHLMFASCVQAYLYQ